MNIWPIVGWEENFRRLIGNAVKNNKKLLQLKCIGEQFERKKSGKMHLAQNRDS